MKKWFAINLVFFLIIVFESTVLAETGSVKVTKVYYPIVLNDVMIKYNGSMFLVDDRVYMPLQTLRNILDVKIDVNEEEEIEISTDENQISTTENCLMIQDVGTICSKKIQYPVILNQVKVEKDVPMISIDDRIYLQLRAVCEVLNIEINWNDEGWIEITDMQTPKVEIGYYDSDGWTISQTLDYELSKETAMVIADDVFLQMKGAEFLADTVVGIRETDDATCYIICRYREPIVPGGDIGIIIRKNDSKILRIILGE